MHATHVGPSRSFNSVIIPPSLSPLPGAVRLLICTDVASRGLDVRELPYVINMWLPDDAETYLHRIGRVGRAEQPGIAVSFVADCKVAGSLPGACLVACLWG